VSWTACTGFRGRHWGRYGAAGLLVVASADEVAHVLLDHRADWVHQGGTIGVPGGAIHPGEEPIDAALREASEEVVGLEDLHVDVVAQHVEACVHCTRWTYTTIVTYAPSLLPVRPRSMESAGLRWIPVDEVERLPLHPGFAAAWPTLRRLVTA
jgi:8-oxo-dGTP diphosphatase